MPASLADHLRWFSRNTTKFFPCKFIWMGTSIWNE